MKVILPSNIGEITLGEYQKYAELLKRESTISKKDFDKKKIHLFTGIPELKVSQIKASDHQGLLEQIDTALNIDAPFQETFFINKFEFGFAILDDISIGEFADLQKYGDEIETLHNTMAVLFRPIIQKVGTTSYSIESYNGTKEYAELMKEMPLSIANGALGFFSLLAKELRIHIQKYTRVELAKAAKQLITSKNGDGFQS